MLDLEPIEKRWRDATGKRWSIKRWGVLDGETYSVVVDADGVAGLIAEPVREEDAQFIAHSRGDVGALIEENKRMREMLGLLSEPTSDDSRTGHTSKDTSLD